MAHETDLAHNPVELGAAIDAVSGEIPGRKITTSLVGRLPTLMKYAYPKTQHMLFLRFVVMTSQVTAVQVRADLERQQDLAVVGETVPMVFLHRFDWGGRSWRSMVAFGSARD